MTERGIMGRPAETERLVEQARGGDEAALRLLYEQYRGPVMRLAYGLLGDRDEAEDLMQESLVWGLTHLERYDPERAALGTWLKVVARSRGHDRLRQRQRRRRGLVGWLRQRRDETVSDPTAELPRRIDAASAVGRAMDVLTPLQREALVLHDVEGWSFREMGDHLGISLRTAQSRVLSAHRAMKRALEAMNEDGPARGGSVRARTP